MPWWQGPTNTVWWNYTVNNSISQSRLFFFKLSEPSDHCESRHLALSASGLACDWYVDAAVFTFRAVTAAPAVGLRSTWGPRERGDCLYCCRKGWVRGETQCHQDDILGVSKNRNFWWMFSTEPDIMIFVFQNIRFLPRLLQSVTQPRRTITVRLEVIAAVMMDFESSGLLGRIQWLTQEFCPGRWGAGVQQIQLRTENRGSGGSCNLVQEISFHIVKSS